MRKPTKKRLAVRLLKVVFSLYLGITVFITLMQMFNEYKQAQNHVENILITAQEIFSESLTNAAWTFDSTQLKANLEGILKMPSVVGIKIDALDKPPDWKQPFPIRMGLTVDNEQNSKSTLQLITHSFQLKKNDILLGDVTLYSSHVVVFDAVKYQFLSIIVAAVVKTIVLWLLFIWAFNQFLGRKLALFCSTMDNADLDNPATTCLTLQTDDVDELCRIESAFNQLLKRLLEKKQALDTLNATLEQKVMLRTQELEQVNAKLTQLSITDSLTGLANRRHFDTVLREECNRTKRSQQPLALMMIDVDWFKKYNDYYGHQAGDDCLVSVAKVLKIHAHRSSDLVARYGGEEFVFITPATDQVGALALATEICTYLLRQQLPHKLSQFGVITVSIGIAVFVANDTSDSLLKKADNALYCAKRQGRNQAVVSDR